MTRPPNFRCLEVSDDGRIIPPVVREDGRPLPDRGATGQAVTATLFDQRPLGFLLAWRRRSTRRW